LLEWTGERFVPGVTGDIEIEHLHRYHAASESVRGLRVLDIACGEGYGSAILAAQALSVVGVDISPEAVTHARATYPSLRLRFEVGSCERIPLGDASVDAVVCFETLEHVTAHDQVMAEFRRVLEPGGFLVISSPDRLEYSDVPKFHNPFHVRELYLSEFRDLLGRNFRNVQVYGQRVQYSSMLAPIDDPQSPFISFRADAGQMVRGRGIVRPVYFVAVASDRACPPLSVGALEPQLPPFVNEMEKLRATLAASAAEAARLGSSFSQQEARVAEQGVQLEAAVSELKEVTRSLGDQLEAQRVELGEQRVDLQEGRMLLSLAEGRTRQLDSELQIVRASRSWRLTAPLRTAMGVARKLHPRRRLRRATELLFTLIYRCLPLGRSARSRIRNQLFRTFPSVFSHTDSYRAWRERGMVDERPVDPRRPSVFHVSPSGTTATNGPLAGTMQHRAASDGWSLPVADGIWEWADGDEIRERVARAEASRRDAMVVQHCEIISLKESDLDAAVVGLRFPEATNPLVSIVVPTYGNFKYTVECLLSIARCGSSIASEVIVADDASTDGTVERLARVPNLRVLPAQQNQGFLRNVNRALPAARGRFVVLLNNDVQALPGWLDALVAPALELKGVGAVGPKVLYPSGHLQEAGCAFRPDGTSEMVGLNDSPDLPQYNYLRDVHYCSGACLLVDAAILRELGGFDDALAPAYCEDSDLCLRLRERGLRVIYNPASVVVHHLSKTTALTGNDSKLAQIGSNLETFVRKWQATLERLTDVRIVAFYLPQFHPIPENDRWWGPGFTEWRNVAQAQPNFVGHYQPRLPADLGFYDLRAPETADRQAALARRYGIDAFCYYYYWFAGRRLLDMPLERLLTQARPDLPFCLCWANENWTRRWDGREQEVLMAQAHSDTDDEAVIRDLIRYLRHPNYLRVNGKPLLAVYRVPLFPNFSRTASTWRRICREEGLGDIYLTMVESFDLVAKPVHPASFGCDAAIEFPPHGMADPRPPSGIVTNARFVGQVADYREMVARYCLREQPGYIRFRGLSPGWDNTARRQDASFCMENATPGAFEAWAEYVIDQTRRMRNGDERLVFVNAWNEWAEGAYLEPDLRFGHEFLEALKNAKESELLKRRSRYALG
jgi:GT2 family glycosyltransferase/SAM-dependent methyltransferase